MKAVLSIAAACALAVPALAQAPAASQGEIWDLDQVRVTHDVPEAKLDALQPDHSLDAVIKTLTGLGITFKRVPVKIFADRLPPKLKEALLALPQGEPFVLPDEDFWTISVIVGRQLPPGSVHFIPTPSPLRRGRSETS